MEAADGHHFRDRSTDLAAVQSRTDSTTSGLSQLDSVVRFRLGPCGDPEQQRYSQCDPRPSVPRFGTDVPHSDQTPLTLPVQMQAQCRQVSAFVGEANLTPPLTGRQTWCGSL